MPTWRRQRRRLYVQQDPPAGALSFCILRRPVLPGCGPPPLRLSCAMAKKRVLVVGGGFAGLAAARELCGGQYDVTVVDPKE